MSSVTFRVRTTPKGFADWAERHLSYPRVITLGENWRIQLQSARRVDYWDNPSRVVIGGITMVDNSPVFYPTPIDYFVFDLTPIEDGTRIDARCYNAKTYRLLFYDMVLRIAKDWPKSADEIYAYLKAEPDIIEHLQSHTSGNDEAQPPAHGETPREASPAIVAPQPPANGAAPLTHKLRGGIAELQSLFAGPSGKHVQRLDFAVVDVELTAAKAGSQNGLGSIAYMTRVLPKPGQTVDGFSTLTMLAASIEFSQDAIGEYTAALSFHRRPAPYTPDDPAQPFESEMAASDWERAVEFGHMAVSGDWKRIIATAENASPANGAQPLEGEVKVSGYNPAIGGSPGKDLRTGEETTTFKNIDLIQRGLAATLTQAITSGAAASPASAPPQPAGRDGAGDESGNGTTPLPTLPAWERIPEHLWDRPVLKLWHEGYTCKEIFTMTNYASEARIRNRLSQLRNEHGKEIVPTNEQRRQKKIVISSDTV